MGEREKSRVGAEMSSKKGRVGTASKSQAKQREQDRRGVKRRGEEQTDRSALSRMTDE